MGINAVYFAPHALFREPNGADMCIFSENFKLIRPNYPSEFPAFAEPNRFLRGCTPGERRDFNTEVHDNT